MSAFDPHTGVSGGAAPILRATASVNGTALPDALLVPDEWLPSIFVRVSPVEVSWFADLPVADAVQACRTVTGLQPSVRRVVDRYFDTPDHALFRRRVSVRLRRHVDPPREIAYEVIAAGWERARGRGRRVHGFVQTFARNEAGDIPRLLARYAAAGYEQVACFDKTRYTFDVAPAHSVDAFGRRLDSPELRGVEGARRHLRVVDFGIKVDVDELRDSPFAEPSLIEVEADASRSAQARPLVRALERALGPRLREKTANKIAYVLGSLA